MTARTRDLWLALGAGALLRVVYFIWAQELPFFNHPITDALYHHRWAQAIATGMIWDGQPFFRAPLYPYVLGLLYALFGADVWVGKVFGHVVGLATGGLLISLAGRLWGRKEAAVTAILWLGSGLILFFEGELLLDSLFAGLCVLALYLLLVERPSPRRLALTGLALGLAAIARPTILVCLPAFVVWIYWYRDTRLWRRLVSFAAGLALPLMLVAGINSYALKRPAGIATQGGINFYVGNNPEATGYTAVLPDPWGYAWNYRQLAQHASRETGRELDAVEVSEFYYRRGWAWIVAEPGPAAHLALKKLIISLSRITISNNLNLPYVQDRLPILQWLPVRLWWLVPLALAGLARWGKSGRARRVLWLCIGFYSVVFVLFFVTERFRLPLLPIWLLLAAYGAGVFWDGRSARRGMNATLALVGIVIAFPNWFGVLHQNRGLAYFNLGNVALRTGANSEAVQWYDSALSTSPQLHQLRLNRGLALLRLGRQAEARRDFEAEAHRFPFDARPFNNLAASALLKGDTNTAQVAIDSGLTRDSTLGLLYMQRLAIAEAQGDTSRLRQTLAAAKRHAGARPLWLYWRGELARLRGDGADARVAYRKFLESRSLWPELDGEDLTYIGPRPEQIDYRMALTHLAEGAIDSAAVLFGSAAQADSSFSEAWANWGTAALAAEDYPEALARYRVAVAGSPSSPVLWTNLAWAHYLAGQTDSALTAIVQALVADSSFGPARALAAQLQSLSQE